MEARIWSGCRAGGRPSHGLAARGPGGTAWIALLSQLQSEGFLKSGWEHGGAACLRPLGQHFGGGAQSSAARQPLLSQVSLVLSSLWGRMRSSSNFRLAECLGEKRCSTYGEGSLRSSPSPTPLSPGASSRPSTGPIAGSHACPPLATPRLKVRSVPKRPVRIPGEGRGSTWPVPAGASPQAEKQTVSGTPASHTRLCAPTHTRTAVILTNTFFYFKYFFLAVPCGMLGLSFPARDQTHTF